MSTWPKKIDFEANTNPYPGSANNPAINTGGNNDSTYAMEGGASAENKSWALRDIDYDWVSEVKAVSFWHKSVSPIGENNGDLPVILIAHKDDNRPTGWDGGSWFYFAMDLWIGTQSQYYIYQQSTQSCANKWYMDGVEVVEHAATTTVNMGSDGDKITSNFTGDIYIDTTINTWHHHYIEFHVPMKHIIFMNDYAASRPRYRGTGKLDDIHFFNANQTLEVINELATNVFGLSPYSDIKIADVLAVRAIDLSASDVVTTAAIPTTWFDDLEGTGETLERSKETRRNTLIDEIFTANTTKTFFDISKSVMNLSADSIKESTRIFKVDANTNTATVNLNTDDTLSDKKGFYVPLTLDNQKVAITSKSGDISFEIERTGVDSDGNATYQITKSGGTANLTINA